MEAKDRIKSVYIRQLSSGRPRYGAERQYPEGMGRARRIAARVFSALGLDPIIERQGVVKSRNNQTTFMGERVVRKSGIVETQRAVPVIRSAEGVRFARSNLEVPGFSGYMQLDEAGEPEGRIWVSAREETARDEQGSVRIMRQPGRQLTPEEVSVEEYVSPAEVEEFERESSKIEDIIGLFDD